MTVSRFILALVVLSLLSLAACAAPIVKVSSDKALLENEVARLPSVARRNLNIAIKIDAPDIGIAREPQGAGAPRFLHVQYAARTMVKEVADAEVARWFQRSNEADPVVTLELRIHDVAFDRLTDVAQWRAVISTEIAVRAHDSSYIYVDSLFSSGAQRGEWIKDYIGIGSEKHPPEYTRLIYRTLLIALDKALADLVLRVPELRDKK